MDITRSILYIDDDHDDIEIISAAIKQADPFATVRISENGIAALEYLFAAKGNKEKLPDLIILDINMPYLDGAATFDKIKEDPILKEIPLVIFTSSENPNDVVYFRSKGVELIHKPHNISNIQTIISQMIALT